MLLQECTAAAAWPQAAWPRSVLLAVPTHSLAHTSEGGRRPAAAAAAALGRWGGGAAFKRAGHALMGHRSCAARACRPGRSLSRRAHWAHLLGRLLEVLHQLGHVCRLDKGAERESVNKSGGRRAVGCQPAGTRGPLHPSPHASYLDPHEGETCLNMHAQQAITKFSTLEPINPPTHRRPPPRARRPRPRG